MQNIKNFKLISATQELLEKFNNDASLLFLQSEDRIEWYEAQDLFSDDTVKIQYNSDRVITAVVDAPVPQRGNTYAVSMLWPVDCSVAEIAVADYPAGVALDGTWKFDEETHTVYRDSAAVDAATLAANTALCDKYAAEAIAAIMTIQCSAAVGNPRDGDADKMLALQQYVDQLRDVDLAANPVSFPVMPESIK